MFASWSMVNRVFPSSTASGIDRGLLFTRAAVRSPAVFDFNQAVGHQTRCAVCGGLVSSSEDACRTCGSGHFTTHEQCIRGWVGIQRYDDSESYGIDLVRNGRTIRIAKEKPAFFEFVDEFKKTVKDYPIDSPYGRIVGEVHLDHIPVDFLKQDYQRSSDEWRTGNELP